MSIVIKGLSIPKNCLLCPCCVGEGIGMGRQYYCQAIDDEPRVSENYHPKNCPLIEIPTPHGRLIDADRFLDWLKEFHPNDVTIMSGIKNARTVIETEVSE